MDTSRIVQMSLLILFQVFFCFIICVPNSTPVYSFGKTVHVDQYHITKSEVFEKLGSFVARTVPGPDGIPAFFITNCQFSLIPLVLIFSLSL